MHSLEANASPAGRISVASEDIVRVVSVLFCKTIFYGTHILIFDWRPQYMQYVTTSFWLITKLKCAIIQ